jgi:hypothetical protein
MTATCPMPAQFHAGDDLPDWLSPSLVKELRQGLRSKIFVFVFLWVQGSMSILLVIETMVAGGGREPKTMGICEGAFWLNVGLMLAVLLPFRGLSSGTEELRPSSLDLQRLTGAEPGQVVMAKWMALLGLSFIVVMSLLPFALLRYNFGGRELLGDMMMLCWLWTGSLVLASSSILLGTFSVSGRAVAGSIIVVVAYSIVLGPAILMLLGRSDAPSGRLLPALFWLPAAGVMVLLNLGGAAMRLAGEVLDAPSLSPRDEFHKW